MNDRFNSRLTASFLESGSVSGMTGCAAAVVAGFGGVMAHSAVIRLTFSTSLLVWLVECWFTVRVLIDASLFRCLAIEHEDAWQRVDELRPGRGFLHLSEGRSAADRQRAAMALWRKQLIALAMRLAILTAAIVLEIARA